MSNKLINRKWQSLIKALNKYEYATDGMESVLKKQIDFEFAVQNFPDDGLCILDLDEANVARIGGCIGIIEEKGILSQEDHENISI